MNRTIERCLAMHEAFKCLGFTPQETHFIQSPTAGTVGIGIIAQDKPLYSVEVGAMEGTPQEIQAQWHAAAAAWNADPASPEGLSQVERTVIWQMNMPQALLLDLTMRLLQMGYTLPGVQAEALEVIKAQMAAAQPEGEA